MNASPNTTISFPGSPSMGQALAEPAAAVLLPEEPAAEVPPPAPPASPAFPAPPAAAALTPARQKPSMQRYSEASALHCWSVEQRRSQEAYDTECLHATTPERSVTSTHSADSANDLHIEVSLHNWVHTPHTQAIPLPQPSPDERHARKKWVSPSTVSVGLSRQLAPWKNRMSSRRKRETALIVLIARLILAFTNQTLPDVDYHSVMRFGNTLLVIHLDRPGTQVTELGAKSLETAVHLVRERVTRPHVDRIGAAANSVGELGCHGVLSQSTNQSAHKGLIMVEDRAFPPGRCSQRNDEPRRLIQQLPVPL